MEFIDKTFVDKVLANYLENNCDDYEAEDTETCESTYGYLCYILSDHILTLRKLSTIEDIYKWIAFTFGGELPSTLDELPPEKKLLLSKSLAYRLNMQIETPPIFIPENSYKSLIETLLKHIFRTTYIICDSCEFGPWDICESLRFMQIPFNFRTDKVKLPISVNGADPINLTFEKVLGVLAFYQKLRTQCNLTILGNSLPRNYSGLLSHMHNAEDYNYIVDFGYERYRFTDYDFYKGILLAAKLLEVDHTKYIREEPKLITPGNKNSMLGGLPTPIFHNQTFVGFYN